MLIVSIRGFILSEHLVDDTQAASTKAPATWWDHAKFDLYQWAVKFGGSARHVRPLRRLIFWWSDRHPVRYRTITLSATWHRAATRPHSTIAIPDKLGPVVYQERAETSIRWSD